MMLKDDIRAVTRFPVRGSVLRRHMAKSDICPECGGELDTGWECNACGFDAAPLVPREPKQ